MSVEDVVVFFAFLQFLVERSKEFLSLCQVVMGPLTCEHEDECVSKVILVTNFGGGEPAFAMGGRTTLRKRKEFDSTMGYPGEDGHV